MKINNKEEAQDAINALVDWLEKKSPYNMKSPTYHSDALLERANKWMYEDFIYDEYGAGARILISNPNGDDWVFADFENHLDAEAFLELMNSLKGRQ